MGKAALLLVLASSIGGATLMLSSQETNVHAAAEQGKYQADVIAREIARTAFNTASADVHRFGTDIDQAIANFGAQATDCANGKAVCARRTGSMLGGTYIAEASYDGGNGVDIYASGTFSYMADGEEISKSHRINESQSVSVLRVSQGGYLRIQFVDSQAGYCSAIFLQRTLPNLEDDEQPLPEMVYAPGKGRNGERNVGAEVYLSAGTQMNFAIGVDNSCYSGGSKPIHHPALRMNAAQALLDSDGDGHADDAGRAALAAEMASYRYRADDWNWTHWALDGSTVSFADPREGPWGMVEPDPSNDQRWRIAFEDIHNWNLPSTHADYNNPNKSLWATKEFGYDWNGSFNVKGNDGQGNGWTDNVRVELRPDDACDPLSDYTVIEHHGEQDGFHDLRNTGSPADFSDQVIMVEIIPEGADGLPAETLPEGCAAA
ncbi:MAG: hypothetical protein AAFN13_15505 [Bacteroidota bacterium]